MYLANEWPSVRMTFSSTHALVWNISYFKKMLHLINYERTIVINKCCVFQNFFSSKNKKWKKQTGVLGMLLGFHGEKVQIKIL